ncbi:hypothetical protein [Emticicia sp. SJ17W-69]|uniref:hypothetical protein n=1 Tax=Emticicia sp. SJ17W-69 TaxID=3421657 RepID=UPI003EBF2751
MENKDIQTSVLLPEILRILVLEEYLENFELFEVRNLSNCWEIELYEKFSNVPKSLLEKEVFLTNRRKTALVSFFCFWSKNKAGSYQKGYLKIKDIIC